MTGATERQKKAVLLELAGGDPRTLASLSERELSSYQEEALNLVASWREASTSAALATLADIAREGRFNGPGLYSERDPGR